MRQRLRANRPSKTLGAFPSPSRLPRQRQRLREGEAETEKQRQKYRDCGLKQTAGGSLGRERDRVSETETQR